MITFFVAGIPRPQGSKRLVRTKAGRTLLLEESKRVKPWRTDVASVARVEMDGAEPIIGAVEIEVVLRFPRPKGHYGTGRNAGRLRDNVPPAPTGKPDLDKCLRAIGDALANIVYTDDSRIVEARVSKRWADHRGPGAEISVSPWAEVAC